MTSPQKQTSSSDRETGAAKVKVLANAPTQALLDSISKRICGSISDALEEPFEDLNERLVKFDDSLGRMDEIPDRLQKIQDALKTVKSDVSAIKDNINAFKDAVTNINWGDN